MKVIVPCRQPELPSEPIADNNFKLPMSIALTTRVPRSDRRGQSFVEDGFEEAAAVGVGGGELHFQPVTEGH